MDDREELILISDQFTGAEKDHLLMIAGIGNDEKVKSVLYEALEKLGGR